MRRGSQSHDFPWSEACQCHLTPRGVVAAVYGVVHVLVAGLVLGSDDTQHDRTISDFLCVPVVLLPQHQRRNIIIVKKKLKKF